MPGFFTKQQMRSKSRPDGRTHSCASCGLYRNAVTPRMEPFGNFRKGILNVGEAPGEVEDERGRQWQGKAGRLLRRTYRELGVDLFEDCLNINAVNCRPVDKDGNNRAPTNQEIACCRRRVLRVIEERRPHVITALGGAAVSSLIGHRWRKDLGGITRWRGWVIPDRDFNVWLCPTFHPSFVERGGGRPEVRTIWTRDLAVAFAALHDDLPRHGSEWDQVEIITDLRPLRNLRGPVAVDFETTGRKPHAPGHRVACASVTDEDGCRAFLMPDTKVERAPFLEFLGDGGVLKIAHNEKFEDAWARVRLRQAVDGWHWDTMLAAHVLDNRRGVTGLKFQTYVNFGLVDYDSEIEPWIHNKDKDNNSFNKVLDLIKDEEGCRMLLKYCGMDSIFTRRLAHKQMREVQEMSAIRRMD